jgi:hypothetical protein
VSGDTVTQRRAAAARFKQLAKRRPDLADRAGQPATILVAEPDTGDGDADEQPAT